MIRVNITEMQAAADVIHHGMVYKTLVHSGWCGALGMGDTRYGENWRLSTAALEAI